MNSTSKLRSAPYGGWSSPITADRIVENSIGLDACAFDGETMVWLEERPGDDGRYVLVRREPDGRVHDVTPAGFSVRSRANEYGGGAFLSDAGRVFFSNKQDQRVWRQDGEGAPVALTPEVALRFADYDLDRARGRLYAVREDHRQKGPAENTLVALGIEGVSEGVVLAQGADFYSSPRLSPDGKRLAWISWSQPDMPWDATELFVGELRDDGTLGDVRHVAGGPGESVVQPVWSPDGELFFASDRAGGWWNLHRLGKGGRVENVLPLSAEFAKPAWRFGQSTYGFVSPSMIACACTQSGRWRVATIDLASKAFAPVEIPFDDVRELRVSGQHVLMLAGSPTAPRSLALLDLRTKKTEVLRASSDMGIDSAYLSVPEEIAFPTESDRSAHALWYKPRNKDHVGPPGARPPLIVMSHGGPTSSTSATFDPEIQFFTSRGFAVVDVNYGGSTGYGRAYRERLNGQWGVVDVDDCVNAAKYLVARGVVDGTKLCIRGGSAGGYTTLCALTFRKGFAAGASYYGVSDLAALASDTHKFEARYLDKLVGPYPARDDLYRARSPIAHADRLSTPVIFLQGLDDKVVPPDQSSRMAAALRKKGIPVAYLAFEGEGHGFDRSESIKRSIEAELYFYAKILGFELPDPIEPVEIDNLK